MFNSNMDSSQLLNMFKKFEKVTIRWIALFTFPTTAILMVMCKVNKKLNYECFDLNGYCSTFQ